MDLAVLESLRFRGRQKRALPCAPARTEPLAHASLEHSNLEPRKLPCLEHCSPLSLTTHCHVKEPLTRAFSIAHY